MFQFKISMAPTLRLSQLFRLLSLGISASSYNTILKRWANKNGKWYLFPRSSVSLHFIAYNFLSKFDRAPKIWVPAYFCEEALFELRKSGAELIFYPLTENFDLDLERVSRQSAFSATPDFIISCHYFGYDPTAHEDLRNFAKVECTNH